MAHIWESIHSPHCLVFLQVPFWALLKNQIQHRIHWCHSYDIVTYHIYPQQNWGKLNEKRPMLCQSLNCPFPLSPVSSKWQTHSGHLRKHLQMVTNGISTEFMENFSPRRAFLLDGRGNRYFTLAVDSRAPGTCVISELAQWLLLNAFQF